MSSQLNSAHGADDDLFGHLLALSRDALEALEEADMDRLGEVMEKRAQAIRDDADRSPRGVEHLAAARLLQDADTRLQLAMIGLRDGVGQHLEAMDSGEAARSAYGPRGRGRGQINVVR